METKIAVLTGVQEYSEGEAVELWLNDKGRIVVRAYNEGGCCATDVDLFDIILWLRDHQKIRVPKSVSETEELILYGKMPCP